MIKKFANMRKLNDITTNSRGGLCFTIVNTEINGKRLTLSAGLIESIGNPKFVDIFHEAESNEIDIVPSENGMPIRKGGAIYSAKLIEKLTNELYLDFSNQTSYSYHEITIRHEDDDVYAEVIVTDMNDAVGREG